MTANREPRWRYTSGLVMRVEWRTPLELVIEDFLREARTDTPRTAHDQCVWESERFAAALAEAGVEATIVSGMRCTTFLGVTIVQCAHVAVRVGDTVYDWTARQFNPDAGFPAVMTVEEWQAEWPDFPSERTYP